MYPPLRARLAVAFLAASAGVSAAVSSTAAQQRDARIPDPGDLWLEISPTLLNWTDQFALGSRDSSIADGSREPLFADFDGPIDGRLYPGPETYLPDLNADADALGYSPVAVQDFSFGSLRYSDINAQVRRLAAGFELGVFSRIAIGVRAPFVLSQVEPSFVYDSTTATVTYAQNAFGTGNTFFSDAAGALTDLDVLIAGGTLTGQALADAMALRTDTDAFLTTLQGRVDDNRLIPTGVSPAGLEMLSRFGDLIAAFEGLGLELPALALPDVSSSADLSILFGGEALAAPLPDRTSTGLKLGDLEISARVNLIDRITARRRPPRMESPDPDAAPGDSTAGGADDRSPPRARGIRLRTTVGALVRVPMGSNGAVPFAEPRLFHYIPVGDAQMDIELSLYQDIALGGWFLLRMVGRHGIQMADDLILRVHPPDRPFALASTQAAVRRDLGDYTQVTVRPAVRVNSALWVGVEYDYWRLGDASFTLLEELADVPDASPLELETGQTRHMLGLGLTYDLQEARSREDIIADRRAIRSPWQFSISMRRSISGSGGRTPAPFFYQATMRIPIGIF